MAQPPDRPMIYLGGRTALTRSSFGHKLLLDTDDLSLTPHILFEGMWEWWTTKVFRERVKPGMHVVDIGSNCGWYSVIGADLVGAQGRLTAFEAFERMADLTFQNLSLNGYLARSSVVQKAVLDDCRPVRFAASRRYRGGSGLYVSEEHAASLRDQIEVVEVEGVSLDAHFAPGTRVDFMKIDAEGAEAPILTGAERLLADNPRIEIIMEFANGAVAATFGGIDGFFDRMSALGFSVRRIHYDGSLTRLERVEAADVAHCDVLLRRGA